jgi:hypothetical protein
MSTARVCELELDETLTEELVMETLAELLEAKNLLEPAITAPPEPCGAAPEGDGELACSGPPSAQPAAPIRMAVIANKLTITPLIKKAARTGAGGGREADLGPMPEPGHRPQARGVPDVSR